MLDPSRGQNRLIAEGPCRATQLGGSATARDVAVQTQAIDMVTMKSPG